MPTHAAAPNPFWPAALRVVNLLHPGCEFGARIIHSAAARLEKALAVQAKRLYYRSRCDFQDFKTDRFRSKVFLSEPQLFQLLLYQESDRYERTNEASLLGCVAENVLIARFVKQLVQLTLPRNAFYVALALGRFLLDYSTAETQTLYEYLFGDIPHTRDDSYGRNRKGLLLAELEGRFGSQLTRVFGPRGEARFLGCTSYTEFRPLVLQCLNEFAPWGTPCFSSQLPGNTEFRVLQCGSANHQNETWRMHVLLHPPCLELLCRGVGFTSPFERLRLPRFRAAGMAYSYAQRPEASPERV